MKTKLELRLRKDLEESLSPKRFNHVMSVSRTAKMLAKTYNEDEYKSVIGALGHDLTKEWDNDKNKEIMNKYFLDQEAIKIPPAWHGYTASILLKEIYGVEDLSIINAIKYHTLGHVDMDNIAKIVYIADFIEPTRKKNNVNYFLDKVGKINLDELLYEVVKYNFEYLKLKQKSIPNQSIKLFDKLKEEFENLETN